MGEFQLVSNSMKDSSLTKYQQEKKTRNPNLWELSKSSSFHTTRYSSQITETSMLHKYYFLPRLKKIMKLMHTSNLKIYLELICHVM